MQAQRIILLVQILLIGSGLTLGLIARFYRVEGEPFASFNPKYWKPVWMMKDRYNPPGYALSLIGTIMIVLGAVWALLQYLILHF